MMCLRRNVRATWERSEKQLTGNIKGNKPCYKQYHTKKTNQHHDRGHNVRQVIGHNDHVYCLLVHYCGALSAVRNSSSADAGRAVA